jgi:hypothetical protein
VAGSILNILPPRVLDFGAVGMGNSMTVTLRTRVDISQWLDATLLLRVRSLDVAGGAIDLFSVPASQSKDDPGIQFVYAFDPSFLIRLDSGITAPNYQAFNFGSTGGTHFTCTATGTRMAAGNIAAVISLDLKLTNYSAQ